MYGVHPISIAICLLRFARNQGQSPESFARHRRESFAGNLHRKVISSSIEVDIMNDWHIPGSRRSETVVVDLLTK
ncbi:unnamed protein product [Cuscuta campestris]|uniref:Uncharacterized protein n=1 Tax=Cuscuta campestris TaxID=132261 RepID=A0A484MU86_9ASTE|nr:unnamed protein product [Cuscuta campestris]